MYLSGMGIIASQHKFAKPLTPARCAACPSTPSQSQSSKKIVLFSNSQYFSFGTFVENRNPSGSSGGHFQSEMPASHTLQHVFMQDYETWPSGRTLFNAGTVFQMTGSHFRWSWKLVDNDWTEKGGKNLSVWRVDPTFVRPNHFLQFPCLTYSKCKW